MRHGQLYKAIAIALMIPILLCGCSKMPTPFSSKKAGMLRVVTNPPNAIVYLRARPERGNGHAQARAEFWAVGTTPFEGRLEPGFWDMRVESPGYEPIEVLLRSVPGRAQAYDLELISLPYGGR